MGMDKKPSMMDETKRLLITAGAAVAANGNALLLKTLSALTDGNVPREKSALALSIGRCVKERPAHHMMSVADVLVDTTYGNDGDLSCSADSIDGSAALCGKTILLVSAGAAMAANCEPCLNTLVPRLIEAGVSEEDIREAVMIGKETRDRIDEATWETATASLGTAQILPSPGCGCGSDASETKRTGACCS